MKYVLDVVLDGCTMYKLLLIVTQRDVLYQKKITKGMHHSLSPLLPPTHDFVVV